MTMPFERTRAVLNTRDFLQWVLFSEPSADSFKQAKRDARTLLRHYPTPVEMDLAHLACPACFGPASEIPSNMQANEKDG